MARFSGGYQPGIPIYHSDKGALREVKNELLGILGKINQSIKSINQESILGLGGESVKVRKENKQQLMTKEHASVISGANSSEELLCE